MELDAKIDDLRLEMNKRDDTIRRLEFEVEKAQKMGQLQNKRTLSDFQEPPSDSKSISNNFGANSQVQKMELENLRLKLTKEYELKIKDLEKLHYERMILTKQETKRAFDITLENMKTIYEDEIKLLKGTKKELEEKVNVSKRELVKKEGDI